MALGALTAIIYRMRPLPSELVSALQHAVYLEQLANDEGGLDRQRRAVRATGAILLAAVQTGWQQRELGAVSGLGRATLSARVAAARALYGNATPALVFDQPLDKRPNPLDVLKQPVDQRQWLTRAEAAALAGVHAGTIFNWDQAQLLPHTDRRAPKRYLFLRADVLRVMRSPRYRGMGVAYAAALVGIASADRQATETSPG